MRKAIRFDTYLTLSVILIALLASVQIFNQPKGLAQECLNSSTTAGEVNYGASRCAPNNELDWDKENMQTLLDKENEMIGANSSEVLYIEGSPGPYTWQVSGAGYSFEGGNTEITTTEPNVTLYTDATACGVAPITVSDGCGNPAVTKDIRGPGQWVTISNTCELGGIPDSPELGEFIDADGYEAKKTDGGRRQIEKIVPVGPGSNCGTPCDIGDCNCNDAQYTATGGGCDPCFSLPPKFNNSSYNCRWSRNDFPLYLGTFYCYDYTVYDCDSSPIYCGENDAANGYMCFASEEQKYEEWQCNP